MGCFSFLCKESGEPALSGCGGASPCYLFLLKDGVVIEEMYGNYDSYGHVFKNSQEDSFEWQMDWDYVCDLMFSDDESNGVAMVLAHEYTGVPPTTRSKSDPNQGWGDVDVEYPDYMFREVKEPYHRIYKS